MHIFRRHGVTPRVHPSAFVAAGVPARVICPLTDEEKKGLRDSADRYVQYVLSYGRP